MMNSSFAICFFFFLFKIPIVGCGYWHVKQGSLVSECLVFPYLYISVCDVCTYVWHCTYCNVVHNSKYTQKRMKIETQFAHQNKCVAFSLYVHYKRDVYTVGSGRPASYVHKVKGYSLYITYLGSVAPLHSTEHS